jgi:WD40 repeat protein
LALSPDGTQLAITTEEQPTSEQDVILIDVKTRATINRFRRTGPEVNALEFARDGASLFEADRSGRTRQWDLRSELCVQEFCFPESLAIDTSPKTGGANQLRLSPNGRILARGRDDGLIGLWDVASGEWLGQLDGGTGDYAVIDFSPDGTRLVAHHPTAIVIWDVQSRRLKRKFAIERCSSNAVRWSPDGSLITQSVTGRVVFINPESGRILNECSDGTAGLGMAFHPQGAVFFSTAYDASIRLWDTRTGDELLALRKHKQIIRALLLSPDGNTLFSADWLGTVLVWDLTYYNDRIRRELEYRASHAANQ